MLLELVLFQVEASATLVLLLLEVVKAVPVVFVLVVVEVLLEVLLLVVVEVLPLSIIHI